MSNSEEPVFDRSLIVRPVRKNDHENLLQLAKKSKENLTSFPDDDEFLRRTILNSLEAFRKLTREPGGEKYLLVLEDLDTKTILGCCGIVSKVGGFEPFYAFETVLEHHSSETLDVRTEVPKLRVLSQHDGPCELTTLFLDPDERGNKLGLFLSLSRFMFVAENPDQFDETVIAELRGKTDNGNPVFWEGVGRHFFQVDFREADRLSATDKSFIEELIPENPLYVPLLPEDARDAIGKIHRRTRPAWRILEREGFRKTKLVDLFDGGPVVRAERDQLRTVKNNRAVKISDVEPVSASRKPYLISGGRADFRVTIGPLLENNGAVTLTPKSAGILDVEPGNQIRIAEL